MAAHSLKVIRRIFGSNVCVVIGCEICGWDGAMTPGYEQTVLASTAECPGIKDKQSAVRALLVAAQDTMLTLWANCSSWQEAICGPLPAFREGSRRPPGAPPDLPPESVTIIGSVVAIEVGDRGDWTVWTLKAICHSNHGWCHPIPIQPPDSAIRPGN